MIKKFFSQESAEKIVEYAELLIAFLLAVVVFLGIISFVHRLTTMVLTYPFLGSTEIHELLDFGLIIFLAIELFRITLAYLSSEPVIREVFIAAMVALGRKVVLYEYPISGLNGAIALSLLVLAVSAAYYISILARRTEKTK